MDLLHQFLIYCILKIFLLLILSAYWLIVNFTPRGEMLDITP
jgi:hypothetical protein